MLTVGQTVTCSGNFTMLGYIDRWSGAELERRVGFHPGRLAPGFAIVALAQGQLLSPTDFELQGSTRWSGGFTQSVPDKELAHLESVLTARGQDLQQLKRKVCEFFGKGGKQTPAKVLPFMEHEAGMQYPNARAIAPNTISGIPQFNMILPRMFTVIKVVS